MTNWLRGFKWGVIFACSVLMIASMTQRVTSHSLLAGILIILGFIALGIVIDRLYPKDGEECCEWEHTQWNGLHKTACGDFDFLLARYTFCPYCGRKIKVTE